MKSNEIHAIARAINSARQSSLLLGDNEDDPYSQVAEYIAWELTTENPRFKHHRLLQWSGVDEQRIAEWYKRRDAEVPGPGFAELLDDIRLAILGWLDVRTRNWNQKQFRALFLVFIFVAVIIGALVAIGTISFLRVLLDSA